MRARTGTVTVTSEGRWRVRVTTPQGKRASLGTYATEAEARRALLADLVVIEDGSPTLSVADWTTRHLDARELGKELRDVPGQRSLCRAHLAADPIGDMLVGSLRRADVIAWTRRLRSRGLARSTVGNALTLLRGAMAAALAEGHTKENPCAGVTLPRSARTEDTWRYLDLAAQARLVAAAGPTLGPLVMFAMATGLRAGELCALRLSDVRDLELRVRYGGPPERPTKSGKIRTVPLLPAAVTAIEAQRAHLAQIESIERAKAKRKGGAPQPTNPLGLLWPAPRGGYRQPKHVLPWAEWRDLVARAEVDPALRWHDLRHTCASALVAGWWGRSWSQLEVRSMLGHGSSAVTERYMHLHGTILERAAQETRAIGPLKGHVHHAAIHQEPMFYGELTIGIEPTAAGLQKPREGAPTRKLAPAAVRFRSASVALLRAVARGNADAAESARRELLAVLPELPVQLLLDLAERALDWPTEAARGHVAGKPVMVHE